MEGGRNGGMVRREGGIGTELGTRMEGVNKEGGRERSKKEN